MVDNRKSSIIYQAYTSLAIKGAELIDILEDSDLYEERTKKRLSDLLRTGRILFALQNEDRLTDKQINSLLYCLIKLARLNEFPSAPILFNIKRPSLGTEIVQGAQGVQGVQGPQGPPGDDASILVENIPSINNMRIDVIEAAGSDPKKFQIAYDPYIQTSLDVNIVGANIYEIGVVVPSININLTTTKQKEDIMALVITNDSTLNTTLQGIINLPDMNDEGDQPVINTVIKSNVSTGFSIVATVTDEGGNNSDSDSISFVYPIFQGISDVKLTGATAYANLTKILQGSGDKNVLFNAQNKFFNFMYPSSYGYISNIYDGNGFIVNDDWEVVEITLQSSGLDNNWSISYYYYSTLVKTNITNQTYKFTY